MSRFTRPVGPQSSATYWRRRLMVGLGLLAVIIVVVLIVVRPGAGSADEKAAPAPTESSTSARTVDKAATEKPEPTTIPTTKASGKDAGKAKACVPADILVKPITDAVDYSESEMPKLSLSVQNTGPKPCTIDAGTAEQEYTITSGSETYWKSSDCQTKPTHTVILLKAHQKLSSTPIGWDRTRSDPSTCDAKRDPVPAGGASYHLTTSLGDISSEESTQFILR